MIERGWEWREQKSVIEMEKENLHPVYTSSRQAKYVGRDAIHQKRKPYFNPKHQLSVKIVKNTQGQIPEDEKKSQAKNKNYFPPKKQRSQNKINKVTTRKGETQLILKCNLKGKHCSNKGSF